MDYDTFYAVIYCKGNKEVREEFREYEEAKIFYDKIEPQEDSYKTLERTVEWENGEEYTTIVERV